MKKSIKTRKHLLSLVVILFALDAYDKELKAASPSSQIESAVQQLEIQGNSNEAAFIKKVQQVGSEALPVLKRHLSSDNASVRRVIMNSLRKLNVSCDEVSDVLAQRLKDPNSLVRHSAISFVDSKECRAEKEMILDLIAKEKDSEVLSNAVMALGAIGDSSDIPRLSSIQSGPEVDVDVRLSALKALIRLKAPYDRRLLEQALQSKEARIIGKAIHASSYSDDLSLVERLEQMTSDDPVITISAKRAIEKIRLNNERTPNARRRILFSKVASSTDPTVTEWAIDTLLKEHDSPSTVAELKAIARDPQNPSFMVVMQALVAKEKAAPEEMMELMQRYSKQAKDEKSK